MALRNQPYLPLYVMDFIADEKLAECSAESTGVYIRVMCIMHKQEEYGVIKLKAKDKQSDNQIQNFAIKLTHQMPYSEKVIERSLVELLDEDVLQMNGDCLSQKRMVRDGEVSRKRAEAGAKGGRSSRHPSYIIKKENKTEGKKQTAHEDDESEIKDENDKAILKEQKLTTIEERWIRFWEAYPKKSGKGAAEKSFKKIKPNKELFEKMMNALETAKVCKQWKADNGQFIPYPATWLNQKRWEDEYEGAAQKDNKPFDWNNDNPWA